MKILLTDAEPVARHMSSHTLAEAGYEVTTASSGAEALDMLREGAIRMAISDWNMPQISGPKFCQLIRAAASQPYVYVILMIPAGRSEDIVAGLAAGADDIITKPFNTPELLLRVNAGRRIVGLESRDLTIFTMAKLAESRDPETGGHLERVRGYCRALAIQLRALPEHRATIDDAYVQMIYETSALHDIGKVAIPEAILSKPGKLTAEEFEVMKSHTTHGARTLESALQQYPEAEFLRMGHDIALSHHERFNGAGYPQGLKGGRIPLAARIVALADTYDALSSRRVYRNAMSHHAARATILQESGRQFDPQVVGAFERSETEFISIHLRFPDHEPEAGPVRGGHRALGLDALFHRRARAPDPWSSHA